LESLRRRINDDGLSDRISITGEDILQEKIPEFMHGGDVYCLPCVWASDNDVDGLPQMLMEAMSCGLPAISTRLVGIPDLVIHEQTGLLVEPRNAQQVADAILRMKDDPDLAKRLALAGRKYCIEKFDIDVSLNPLLERFRQHLTTVNRSNPPPRMEPSGQGQLSESH
jgi:glycosyltransferase involved in cell wall biosynthesis